MSKRILYIEDDAVDQKIFLRAMSNSEAIIDIADSFEMAYKLSAATSYDLVVSDHHVGPDDLVDELDNWDQEKLIVLSNQLDNNTLSSLSYFEKPFRIDMLAGFIDEAQDVPTSNQLDALCGDDQESKGELVELIQKELELTQSKLSDLSNEETQQKSEVIHKALNKIAILGMKQSRFRLLAFEKQLSSKTPLSAEEDKQVAHILNKALDYVKQIRL